MSATLNSTKPRIASIDFLRGLIMVIMALDHTRDYFHIGAMTSTPTDLSTTTPLLFFTRWITHFCAPLFLFLSGISAFLNGQNKTKKELSIFLIKRGFFLIVFEIVVMNLILTFNPAYNIIFLITLWAFGWSMVILGLLIRTNAITIAIIGTILFFGHNLLDKIVLDPNSISTAIINILLTSKGNAFPIGGGHIILVGYTILPWASIMLLGYSFGHLFSNTIEAQKRKRFFLFAGLGIITYFLLMRGINMYGDPNPWATQKNSLFTFLSFFNITKTPPSLLFGCMTIGPGLIVLSFSENLKNKFSQIVMVYGKAFLFYFAGYFLLLHLLLVIFFYATGHTNSQIVDPESPFLFRPTAFGFSLRYVYLLWIAVVAIMYYPCKWFYKYKKSHNSWWLRYM